MRDTLRRRKLPRSMVHWVPFVGRYRWVAETWVDGDAVINWGVTRRRALRRLARSVRIVREDNRGRH